MNNYSQRGSNLTDRQYSFMKRRSFITNLVDFDDRMSSIVDERE